MTWQLVFHEGRELVVILLASVSVMVVGSCIRQVKRKCWILCFEWRWVITVVASCSQERIEPLADDGVKCCDWQCPSKPSSCWFGWMWFGASTMPSVLAVWRRDGLVVCRVAWVIALSSHRLTNIVVGWCWWIAVMLEERVGLWDNQTGHRWLIVVARLAEQS